MIRANIASANKSVVWRQHRSEDGAVCLPYFKYGDEYYPIQIVDLDVFFCRYNPVTDTKLWERGQLRNEEKELWF